MEQQTIWFPLKVEIVISVERKKVLVEKLIMLSAQPTLSDIYKDNPLKVYKKA